MGCRTQAGFRVWGHPWRSDPPKSWHVGHRQAHNVFLQGGPSEKKSGVHTSKPQAAAAFFFFFCPKLLERVPCSILKGQAMEGQGSWLQMSGCRNSLSLATVHHVGQVMRFLYPFHETDVHWGSGKGPRSCSHCSPP